MSEYQTEIEKQFEKETNDVAMIQSYLIDDLLVASPRYTGWKERKIIYLTNELSQVEKENKELKEGLRFYANKERYRFYDLQRGSVETVELDNDKGQIARNLLNKIKDEDKE